MTKKNKGRINLQHNLPEKKPVKNKPVYKYSKWLITGILLLTTIIYFKSLDNQLTNWDDKGYLNDNQGIKQLHGDSLGYTLKYFFNPDNPQMGNYHPLTMISYGMEYNKFQLDPKPYHITNLILHLLACLLVFFFIRRLVKNEWIAGITALLFAIHPMHVESVAWVSERKDVLYGFFFVFSLWAYLKSIDEKTTSRKFYYLLSLLLFVASSLSKAMAVCLPVVLVGIDWYLKRPFNKKVILEKIPFIIVSLILGIVALNAQAAFHAIEVGSKYSFAERILFACYGISAYLYKFFVPVNLSCFYDYPEKSGSGYYPYYIYLGVLGTIFLGWLAFRWRTRFREGLFGIFFFLVTIALVLQILPVGQVIIAERYTYIPYLGIAFIVALFIVRTINSPKFRWIVLGISVIFIAVLSALAYQRTKVWKDSISLWNDAIKKDNKVARQYKIRGDAYREIKEYGLAIKDYNSAVALNTFDADAYFNRGMTYQDLFNAGNDTTQLQKAVKSYELAVNYKNNDATFHNTLGLAYYFAKNYTKSIESFSKALELRPDYKEVYNNRIGSYIYTGQYENALRDAIHAQDLGYPIDPIFIKSLTEKVNTLK